MMSSIPSPPLEWMQLSAGPLTITAYALWILTGIAVGLWMTSKRWVDRGGNPDLVLEIALWAIPFGIVGGRIYHVISTPGPYFGDGGDPMRALRIWDGGLGIWGAVALGVVGAYVGARRHGASFTAFLDAAAPGLIIAQAIGRMGNYFNHELYGAETELPWGLEIAPEVLARNGHALDALYHPTFLYEMLWNVAAAFLIIYLDRKWDLRGGRVFWLYIVVYTVGRTWIELLRIDEAVIIAGLRVNVWVSIAVLTTAVVSFVLVGRKQSTQPRPEREKLAATTTS